MHLSEQEWKAIKNPYVNNVIVNKIPLCPGPEYKAVDIPFFYKKDDRTLVIERRWIKN